MICQAIYFEIEYVFRTWLKPIRVSVYLCFCNSYFLAPRDPKERLCFIHQADTKSILRIFSTFWSFVHDVRSHLIKDFKVKIYWNERSEQNQSIFTSKPIPCDLMRWQCNFNMFAARLFCEIQRFSLKIFKSLEFHNSLYLYRRRKCQPFWNSQTLLILKGTLFRGSISNRKMSKTTNARNVQKPRFCQLKYINSVNFGI